jgi:hypothetical protein
MPQFRKKPVVIDAHQFHGFGKNDGLPIPDGVKVAGDLVSDATGFPAMCLACGDHKDAHGIITTPNGNRALVCPGDWIIAGLMGDRYACKPDIFAATFDPA